VISRKFPGRRESAKKRSMKVRVIAFADETVIDNIYKEIERLGSKHTSIREFL
jgi:hypothetical protein